MGDYIKWFEKKFYKDTVFIGSILTLSLITITFLLVFIFDYFVDNLLIQAIIASSGIASNMLYKSVKDIANNPDNIKYLVSRDTKDLSDSDKYKAGIETYAENLSDGVVAPLFYLVCFGLYGLFIYKAVNTLDSMVGYRTKRYENYGKFSAILDDILNYIPSRITAIIIAILFGSFNALFNFARFGKLHKSPNAGYPISAMAISLDIPLGGDTSYFGKIIKKPYFSNGSKPIDKQILLKAVSLQIRFDIFIILLLFLLNTQS
jgi:adenosylcobinamide-phosphate synthase